MDLWKEQSPDGLHPNVSNVREQFKASGGEKALWIIFIILSVISIIGWIFILVWYFKTKNRITEEENVVNEASSSIQIMQSKRFDTLNKLVQQVKSHYKFESETLDKITKNRAGITRDINQNEQALGEMNRMVNIAFEQYPDLKSSHTIMELMSSSAYLDREIASTRHTYNAKATDYNAQNKQFMRVIVADKMKKWTMPIFAASSQERRDVNMEQLSNW